MKEVPPGPAQASHAASASEPAAPESCALGDQGSQALTSAGQSSHHRVCAYVLRMPYVCVCLVCLLCVSCSPSSTASSTLTDSCVPCRVVRAGSSMECPKTPSMRGSLVRASPTHARPCVQAQHMQAQHMQAHACMPSTCNIVRVLQAHAAHGAPKAPTRLCLQAAAHLLQAHAENDRWPACRQQHKTLSKQICRGSAVCCVGRRLIHCIAVWCVCRRVMHCLRGEGEGGQGAGHRGAGT